MARRFQRDERQAVEWSAIPSSSLSITAAGTFLQPGILSFATVATIRRIRGVILYHLEGTLAAGDLCVGASGLGIFSTDAVTAGAASLPDPNAEPEFPWLWYRSRHFSIGPAVTNATWDQPAANGTVAEVVEVDTKAMRKVKPGQTLALVHEYVNIVGPPPLGIEAGVFRVLLGLH